MSNSPSTPQFWVRRRDSAGDSGPGTPCDSLHKAREVVAEYRLQDFVEVWIEDAEGRRVSETP